MVSFRHHLISIIAIFLALAVGVALGAGPLRDGASNLLTGQNEELTAQRDSLADELDTASGEIEDLSAVIDALAGSVSQSALDSVTVALVVLPGAEEDDVVEVTNVVTQAGADITSRVSVTAEWADADLAFRQSFSAQVAGYLSEETATGATPEYVLSAALAQVMSGGADGEVIGELLMAGDAPFVTEIPAGPVESFIVIGPRVASESIDWGTILTAFDAAAPTTGLGQGVVESARSAATSATTVDSVPASFAFDLLPLAVAAELAGNGGHWGVSEGADNAVPPLPAEPHVEDAPDPETSSEESDATDSSEESDT